MSALLLFAAAAPFGREPWIAPHAGYVYPAGGRHGATFEDELLGIDATAKAPHLSGEVWTVLTETTRLKEIL